MGVSRDRRGYIEEYVTDGKIRVQRWQGGLVESFLSEKQKESSEYGGRVYPFPQGWVAHREFDSWAEGYGYYLRYHIATPKLEPSHFPVHTPKPTEAPKSPPPQPDPIKTDRELPREVESAPEPVIMVRPARPIRNRRRPRRRVKHWEDYMCAHTPSRLYCFCHWYRSRMKSGYTRWRARHCDHSPKVRECYCYIPTKPEVLHMPYDTLGITI